MNSTKIDFRKLQNLKGLEILIVGHGVTGKALEQFCLKLGAEVFITDFKELELKNFIEHSRLKDYEFDLCLKSPGVPWNDKAIEYCKLKKIQISGEIELVSSFTNIPIIAVTGTNGKSSVVNMISHGFDLVNKKHFLGGNWGVPFSTIIENKYKDIEFAILELSSFQLELVESFCADYVLFTNLHPHHMERYEKFEDYRDAKLKVAKNAGVTITHKEYKSLFKASEVAEDLGGFPWSEMRVKGEHNQENFLLVCRLFKILNISQEAINENIRKFPGIKYRLEFIREHSGVRYFNDSKSTSLEASLTALKSFSLKERQNLKLLLGGKPRSKDVSDFTQILNFLKQEQIYLYGESAVLLKEIFPQSHLFESLKESFDAIKKTDGIVLLSPGFSSYDQYQNFEKRGEEFSLLVKDI